MHALPWLIFATLVPTLGETICAQSPAATQDVLTIPAFAGYAHPDSKAMRRDRKTGAVASCKGELRFYFEVATSGRLHVSLDRLAGAPSQRLRVVLSKLSGKGGGTALADAPALNEDGTTEFRGLATNQPGAWYLKFETSDGSALKGLRAVRLGGPGAAGAKASTVERRNAASVHLWYDVPRAHRDDIEWFYCELTPKTDPLWTYYMATGWHRGYFGMQVNSKTERRIIFSVWDSGNEAIDRKKVKTEDLVQLMGKGEKVHAGGFGNEGTGGHSHLVHDWQIGDTVRFVVLAQPDGKHTTYTGWFAHDKAGKGAGEWQLVASFKAPRDGKHLHGLYSFSENFSGANGDRDRQCDYGNVWLRTKGGEWLAVRGAKFTHDGHGNKHRPDHRGGVRNGRFFLQHGDFRTPPMQRGTALKLPGTAGSPPTPLPKL